MNLPLFTPDFILPFLLVMLRVSAMVITMPIIGHRSVPVRIKASLSLVLAFMIFPFVGKQMPAISPDFIPLVLQMAGEVMVGLIIGFTARFVFTGIQFAGELIGIQMGFSMASVLDPMTDLRVSVVAEMQYLMAMLVFLAINGHHIFIAAMADSYRILAPFEFNYSGQLMQMILDLSKEVFVIAVKASAPVIAVLLFTNLGLALIARTVPQINILIVGFPIQIAAGLIFLGLSMPIFLRVVEQYCVKFEGQILSLLRLM